MMTQPPPIPQNTYVKKDHEPIMKNSVWEMTGGVRLERFEEAAF